MDEAEAMAHTVTVTASTVKDWWLHQKQGYSCGYCADVCADARFADLANRLHEGRCQENGFRGRDHLGRGFEFLHGCTFEVKPNYAGVRRIELN